ncbi:hypothetical protein QN277_003866 [Acacia crassicarpa]|nr:hypothetical protein QN277_003866 [Acacia crassicarpa]
MILVLHW